MGCRRWRTPARRGPRSRPDGRELAVELAPRGIAVVRAAIGRFDTESLNKYPEVVQAGAARGVPLQRLGEMREFAWLVALLASPVGHALSGSVVTLDGGLDNFRTVAAAGPRRRRRRRAHRGPPPGALLRYPRPDGLRAKCCGCTGAFQAPRAGSIPVARSDEHHGEWRSLVAHPAGGRAVAGSNPVSPIDESPGHNGALSLLTGRLEARDRARGTASGTSRRLAAAGSTTALSCAALSRALC